MRPPRLLLVCLPFVLGGCFMFIHADGMVAVRGSLVNPDGAPISPCKAHVTGGHVPDLVIVGLDNPFTLKIGYAGYLWSGATRLSLRFDCDGFRDTTVTVEWAGGDTGWRTGDRALGRSPLNLGSIVLEPGARFNPGRACVKTGGG